MAEVKMETESAEPINFALRDHQTTVKDWNFKELTTDLHNWAERIIFEFKLETGIPALMMERLRRTRLGHYRPGRNAFGLRDEVAIDQDHAQTSSYWRVLGSLLHELIHAWQEHNGTPPSAKSHNYHNKQFRKKALSLGLIVDHRGYTQYAPGDTPFLNLLRKSGLEVPEIPEPEPVLVRPSRTKLRLWECPCGVKARVGRSRFNAKCLDCGGLFQRKH